MDWGALWHRLRRNHGWTPREILMLTAREALECLEFARRRAKSIVVAPLDARRIVAATRERRRLWIDDELRRSAERRELDADDEPSDWERLAVMSASLSRENVVDESDGRVSERIPTSEAVGETQRGDDWLKRIHDELRLLRQAVAGPVVRSLWSE